MGQRSDAIIGYTYDAENLCPRCMMDAMTTNPAAWPNCERMLDELAGSGLNPRGEVINRRDEGSFDSGDFPKVILASMLEEPEQCYQCGERLE